MGSFLGSVNFGWGAQNNLVRTREMYAKQGFLVATMDAPSNMEKMNAIWRMGGKHAADINAVARYLKSKANAPVWVIGNSMGTFSAANAGIRLNDSIDGIVLTSSRRVRTAEAAVEQSRSHRRPGGEGSGWHACRRAVLDW